MNQPTTPQTWRERFREKFTVLTGTKKIRRVGFWLQPQSEFPTCHSAEDIESFIQQTIEQEVKKERAKIIKEIENTLFEGQASEGSLGFGEIINKIESVKE